MPGTKGLGFNSSAFGAVRLNFERMRVAHVGGTEVAVLLPSVAFGTNRLNRLRKPAMSGSERWNHPQYVPGQPKSLLSTVNNTLGFLPAFRNSLLTVCNSRCTPDSSEPDSACLSSRVLLASTQCHCLATTSTARPDATCSTAKPS